MRIEIVTALSAHGVLIIGGLERGCGQEERVSLYKLRGDWRNEGGSSAGDEGGEIWISGDGESADEGQRYKSGVECMKSKKLPS